ncbi:MAG TPA: serine/threonine-protein kinase, partial [Kofleriaceae bacterium]|nr:serine/threonine-protein kinase [Kofleriaceae bacterium]
DVKPENIFLVQRSQGRWGVKVVDFGIAKTPLAPRMARPDETAGSPMFMAPEVCRGDEVDQRADVYSFGILLYLMMCGRLPFVADSVHRVLQMQLVQLPRPPREINSELSPELAIIVERALAKNPDDRYPSMGALLRDLEAALPKGADRLLIEAQSGTSLQATPFAGALGRRDSQRTRTPSTPPDNAGTSVITLPRAPSRRTRLPVVIGAIAIGALSGVVAWRQLVVAPTAAARARDRGAPGNPLPGPTVVAAHTTAPSAENRPATASAPAAAAPVPTSAEAAAAPPEPPAGEPTDPPASASGDDRPDDGAAIAMALATAPARGGHTAALKRPLVRIKPPLRRDPARPGKRVGLATGATGAAIAPAVGPAEATPPAAPEAGSAAAHAEPPAEREATAAVQPAPAALPASAPPPLPLPTPPPPPPSPGTLDATPSIGALDVKGSLSPAIVRRSIERTLGSLRACYRTAARAAGSTPAVDLRLSFEIDENSLATRVAASGGSLGSLASCATQVTGQIRTPEAPDVGTAQVIVVIRFRPS